MRKRAGASEAKTFEGGQAVEAPLDWQCPNQRCVNHKNGVFAKHSQCPVCRSTRDQVRHLICPRFLPPGQVWDDALHKAVDDPKSEWNATTYDPSPGDVWNPPVGCKDYLYDKQWAVGVLRVGHRPYRILAFREMISKVLSLWQRWCFRAISSIGLLPPSLVLIDAWSKRKAEQWDSLLTREMFEESVVGTVWRPSRASYYRHRCRAQKRAFAAQVRGSREAVMTDFLNMPHQEGETPPETPEWRRPKDPAYSEYFYGPMEKDPSPGKLELREAFDTWERRFFRGRYPGWGKYKRRARRWIEGGYKGIDGPDSPRRVPPFWEKEGSTWMWRSGSPPPSPVLSEDSDSSSPLGSLVRAAGSHRYGSLDPRGAAQAEVLAALDPEHADALPGGAELITPLSYSEWLGSAMLGWGDANQTIAAGGASAEETAEMEHEATTDEEADHPASSGGGWWPW